MSTSRVYVSDNSFETFFHFFLVSFDGGAAGAALLRRLFLCCTLPVRMWAFIEDGRPVNP
jgi:hypothetical protein